MKTTVFLAFLLHDRLECECCHFQGLLGGVEMYAFYSLLVYIFYTVFKKEEDDDSLEGACGASSDVCLATSCPFSGVVCQESIF